MNEKINKIFSVVLSIIFGFTLLIGFTLHVVRESISLSMLSDLLSSNVFSYVEVDEFSNIKRMSLNSDVDRYLDEYNIDKEVINDILQSEKFQNVIDKYQNEITDYLSGKNDNININSEDINGIVNDFIVEYEKETGIDIDSDKVNEEIDKAINQINSGLVEVKDNQVISKVISFVFGSTVFYILVVVNFVLALGVFLLNMNIFKTLKYLSIPTIVVSVILLICGLITGSLNIDILNVILNNLSNNFYTYGITNLVIGVIALVLGIVCTKEKKIDL